MLRSTDELNTSTALLGESLAQQAGDLARLSADSQNLQQQIDRAQEHANRDSAATKQFVQRVADYGKSVDVFTQAMREQATQADSLFLQNQKSREDVDSLNKKLDDIDRGIRELNERNSAKNRCLLFFKRHAVPLAVVAVGCGVAAASNYYEKCKI